MMSMRRMKRWRGGVKGLLNNVKKNCTFLTWRLPLSGFQDNFFIWVFDNFRNVSFKANINNFISF